VKRGADAQELDLSLALDLASAAAKRVGVEFEHRIELNSPASSLVVSASDPTCAQIAVTTIGAGMAYVDIGAGLHGEWLLRDAEELAHAKDALGELFEAVFRGDVEERVRKRRGRRHTVRGSITTRTKTHRFRHHALGLSTESGVHHYAPYPAISG